MVRTQFCVPLGPWTEGLVAALRLSLDATGVWPEQSLKFLYSHVHGRDVLGCSVEKRTVRGSRNGELFVVVALEGGGRGYAFGYAR